MSSHVHFTSERRTSLSSSSSSSSSTSSSSSSGSDDDDWVESTLKPGSRLRKSMMTRKTFINPRRSSRRISLQAESASKDDESSDSSEIEVISQRRVKEADQNPAVMPSLAIASGPSGKKLSDVQKDNRRNFFTPEVKSWEYSWACSGSEGFYTFICYRAVEARVAFYKASVTEKDAKTRKYGEPWPPGKDHPMQKGRLDLTLHEFSRDKSIQIENFEGLYNDAVDAFYTKALETNPRLKHADARFEYGSLSTVKAYEEAKIKYASLKDGLNKKRKKRKQRSQVPKSARIPATKRKSLGVCSTSNSDALKFTSQSPPERSPIEGDEQIDGQQETFEDDEVTLMGQKTEKLQKEKRLLENELSGLSIRLAFQNGSIKDLEKKLEDLKSANILLADENKNLREQVASRSLEIITLKEELKELKDELDRRETLEVGATDVNRENSTNDVGACSAHENPNDHSQHPPIKDDLEESFEVTESPDDVDLGGNATEQGQAEPRMSSRAMKIVNVQSMHDADDEPNAKRHCGEELDTSAPFNFRVRDSQEADAGSSKPSVDPIRLFDHLMRITGDWEKAMQAFDHIMEKNSQ